MRRLFFFAILIAILAPPQGRGHTEDPPAEVPCSCDILRRSNGWCRQCRVGYVAGARIESHVLFDALDLRGHPVDIPSLECEGCRQAASKNSICARCGWGIAGGKVYSSKLTYYLALAQQESDPIECDSCRTCSSGAGWCESCGRGWTGSFAYRDRRVYEAAAREYALLKLAVRTLDRCETCAVARYFGSRCPACGIEYRDGEPLEATPR